MATTKEVRSDSSIREDVLLELKWDPKIKSNDIATAVKDGVVTLSGFVSSFWELDAAEKAAKRVYGVKAVANDLEVKLFWQRTDPEIARSAVQTLESHVSIPSENIRDSVKNGRVTLEGTVTFAFQKISPTSPLTMLRDVTAIA